MTKQELAEQLFTWANNQKVMVPNSGMRKKFAQRLKFRVLKLLEDDEVSDPKEPIRGGCVTVTRLNSKQEKTNDSTILTEVLSMKGDKNNPFNK